MGIGSLLGRLLGGHAWVVSEQVEAQAQEPLAYPAQITLDGVPLTVRLATAADEEAMLAFARRLPEHDAAAIRALWSSHVRGGSAREDRSGQDGQRRISTILKRNGLVRGNPDWSLVIEHGRSLYRQPS